jgi:hypothetical protein
MILGIVDTKYQTFQQAKNTSVSWTEGLPTDLVLNGLVICRNFALRRRLTCHFNASTVARSLSALCKAGASSGNSPGKQLPHWGNLQVVVGADQLQLALFQVLGQEGLQSGGDARSAFGAPPIHCMRR